jgi:hypothetical protein
MADALSDFEGLITEGFAEDEALEVCAREYNVKVEVLAARTASLGDLEQLRVRNSARAKTIRLEHLTETAVDSYLANDPEQNFPEWFKNRTGRMPTKAEVEDFTIKYCRLAMSRLDIRREGMYD